MTNESAPVPIEYELLTTAEGVSVYENKAAKPRAFFADQTVVSQSQADTLRILSDSKFDPHSTTVIERAVLSTSNTGAVEAAPGAETTNGQATIIEDKRNRVVIRTESDAAGLLVLSDNYYPGWKAFVDGTPAEILRANATMRAVNVSSGSHLVSFEFMPAAFFSSLYISLASAAVTLAAIIFSFARKQRSNGNDLRQDQKDG